MLHYILQVITFQLLFLVIYDVFLKKETFFNLNRVYLLLTAILSMVIPFMKFEKIKAVVSKDFEISLPEIILGNPSEAISTIDPEIAMQAGINLDPSPTSVWNIVFISGICIATLILFIKAFKLVYLISKSHKQWEQKMCVVSLPNSNKAFSFFNYIFLGEQLEAPDKSSILKHEMVHVRQKHSWDLLFFEVMRIGFWFNPLVYMYQNRIAVLHEYIADSKVVKHQNKADYYDNLLTQIFETQQFSFVNPFFKQSLIKKRILMLNKSRSKHIKLFKYLLIIPLIMVMLVYTSCSIFKKTEDKTEVTTETTMVETEERPFGIVDEVPVYKSCEYLKTNDERKTCMSQNISMHVNKNFNASIADSLGLIGKQRINVLFKIDKNGNVAGVKARAPHPDLEQEAIRVIKTLPKFTPGKHEGKTVVVPYSLPIIFQVKADSRISQVERTKLIEEIETLKQGLRDSIQDQSNGTYFSVVDEVPIYKSCVELTTRDKKKKCVSQEISKYVTKNFNLDLASKLGLVGSQRINVIFKIDKRGNVTNAKARAPHPDLETEALRVINSLPQFIPGKNDGKPVVVNYSLPISFQIAPKSSNDKKN